MGQSRSSVEIATCHTCKVSKPFSCFPKHKKKKNGIGTECKDCFKIYIKKWRLENRERYIKHAISWNKSHPEKRKALEANRRVRSVQGNVMLHYSQMKIIDTIYESSKRISDCIGINHHVDHIVPISKGGYHVHTNLQIIPAIINFRKSNKLNYSIP